MFVVDLGQLERRARAKPFALGARHIGVVELALQPELRRMLMAPGVLEPNFERTFAAIAGHSITF